MIPLVEYWESDFSQEIFVTPILCYSIIFGTFLVTGTILFVRREKSRYI